MSDTLHLLRELGNDFEGDLIGLAEFADLAGFDPSRTAQLRTDRKNGASGFPAVVSDNGRSYLHRLDELVDWTTASRHADMIRVDTDHVAQWRLERRLRTVVERIGVVGARHLLVALALTSRTVAPDDLRTDLAAAAKRAGTPLTTDLVRFVDDDGSDLVGLVIDELVRTGFDTALVDRVLVELGEHQPGVSRRSATALARLIAVALDAGPGDAVHEPTCGECETLLAVARLAAERDEHIGPITGTDRDAAIEAIGRARLQLAGVDARIGEIPADGSVDRLVVDPGGEVDADEVSAWTRLLTGDGRVALVTRDLHLDPLLLAELPPRAIVIPPQELVAPGRGVTMVWVSDRGSVDASTCHVIDLRPTSPPTRPPLEERLDALTRALGVRPVAPLLADHAELRDVLAEAVPDAPRVHEIELAEFHDQLRRAVDGTLGRSAYTVAENQKYALALARELERLIGGRTDGTDDPLTRPADSPDGVLAGQTTDEARRVVARIVDSLSGRRGNRKRPV